MDTQKLTQGGGKFFASGSTVVENGALTYIDPCVPGADCLIAVGNGS
jgi:hypothetical protein